MHVRSTRHALELGLSVEIPLIVLAWLAWGATKPVWFWDFSVFRTAGHAVLHGHSPYVAPTAALLAGNNRFVYPTPYAFLFAPFAVLPPMLAKVVFLVLSAGAIFFALRLLGVRDRRCFGVALFSVPVYQSLAFGTIGPLLLLLLAAAWRLRDRAVAGVLLAIAAAAKLLLWPVLIWLVATRRIRASAASIVTLAVLSLLWILVDLQGLRHYAATVRILNEVQRWKSYSLQSLAISFQLSPLAGEALILAVAMAGIAAICVLSRGRDGDRRGFAAAVVVAILATPILWEHYLVLLLVPIALARPKLSLLWLLPVGLWITPRVESADNAHVAVGDSWKMLVVLAVSLVVGVVAIRSKPLAGDPRRRVSESVPRPLLSPGSN